MLSGRKFLISGVKREMLNKPSLESNLEIPKHQKLRISSYSAYPKTNSKKLPKATPYQGPPRTII